VSNTHVSHFQQPVSDARKFMCFWWGSGECEQHKRVTLLTAIWCVSDARKFNFFGGALESASNSNAFPPLTACVFLVGLWRVRAPQTCHIFDSMRLFGGALESASNTNVSHS